MWSHISTSDLSITLQKPRFVDFICFYEEKLVKKQKISMKKYDKIFMIIIVLDIGKAVLHCFTKYQIIRVFQMIFFF